jgi:hypothetical protein
MQPRRSFGRRGAHHERGKCVIDSTTLCPSLKLPRSEAPRELGRLMRLIQQKRAPHHRSIIGLVVVLLRVLRDERCLLCRHGHAGCHGIGERRVVRWTRYACSTGQCLQDSRRMHGPSGEEPWRALRMQRATIERHYRRFGRPRAHTQQSIECEEIIFHCKHPLCPSRSSIIASDCGARTRISNCTRCHCKEQDAQYVHQANTAQHSTCGGWKQASCFERSACAGRRKQSGDSGTLGALLRTCSARACRACTRTL